MNPTALTEDLYAAINTINHQKIKLSSYPESLQSILFDIFSSESAIMGIADTIAANQKISVAHFKILDTPVLEGNFWLLANSQKHDLENNPEILEYALNIDILRKICQKIRS